jgi:hypothetical protein
LGSCRELIFLGAFFLEGTALDIKLRGAEFFLIGRIVWNILLGKGSFLATGIARKLIAVLALTMSNN